MIKRHILKIWKEHPGKQIPIQLALKMSQNEMQTLIYFSETDWNTNTAGGIILSKPIDKIFTDWNAIPLMDQTDNFQTLVEEGGLGCQPCVFKMDYDS